MKRFLVPEYVFRDVTHIRPEFLAMRGIRALALDVDNTLTEHGSQQLRPDIEEWLEETRAAGIRMAILSNNNRERVAPFAQKTGMEFVSFACKPLPLGLDKLRRSWHIPRGKMALVGDQIYTDALAAALYGVPMLLVRPLATDVKKGIRLKRKLESPVLWRYYKDGGELL